MAGLGLEETELRLGLPGGGNVEAEEAGAAVRSSGKRSFAETIDLKLKLEPASAAASTVDDEQVADGVAAAEQQPSPAAAAAGDGQMKRSPSQSSVVTSDPEKPRAPKYVFILVNLIGINPLNLHIYSRSILKISRTLSSCQKEITRYNFVGTNMISTT
jgi:hypothetical protein